MPFKEFTESYSQHHHYNIDLQLQNHDIDNWKQNHLCHIANYGDLGFSRLFLNIAQSFYAWEAWGMYGSL